MGSIYPRGNRLWARYKNETGDWEGAATPFRVGEEVKAKRFLREVENRIEARTNVGASVGLEPGESIPVARYAARWIADRKSARDPQLGR